MGGYRSLPSHLSSFPPPSGTVNKDSAILKRTMPGALFTSAQSPSRLTRRVVKIPRFYRGAFAPLGTHHPTCPALPSRPPSPALGELIKRSGRPWSSQSSRLTRLTVRQSTVTLPTGPTGMSNKTCFVTPVSLNPPAGTLLVCLHNQEGREGHSRPPDACLKLI